MFNQSFRRLTSLLLAVGLGASVSLTVGAGAAIANGAPANDNIGSASPLTVTSAGSVQSSNVDATLETGETAIHGNDTLNWYKSVWYRVQPNAGFIEFTTAGSDFDTVLAAFSFDTATGFINPVRLDANDDSSANLTSTIAFNASGTLQYFIGVASFDNSAGAFTLSWRLPPPITNDDIADAITLNPTGDPLQSESNFNSSEEPGEISFFTAERTDSWANSVWYKVVNPAAGAWGVKLTNMHRSTVAILDDDDFSTAQIINFGSNQASFNSDGSTTYYIAIGGIQREQSFDIQLESFVRPSRVLNVNVTVGSVTTVTWEQPTTFDPNTDGYEVEFTDGVNFRACRTNSETSCTFPRMGNGTWTLDVFAQNSFYGHRGVVIQNVVEIQNVSNDYFAAATPMASESGSLDDYFDFARVEVGEPLHTTPNNFHSLWYSYTPSTTGTTTFSAATKNVGIVGEISPVVAVYTGTELSNLQRVHEASSTASWNSVAGRRYYVAVSTANDFSGLEGVERSVQIALTWSHVAAPPETAAPTTTTAPLPQITTVKAKNNATMASILKKAKIKPPKNSKVTYTIARSSKKLCSISSNKLKFKKKGTCNMSVKVKPKKGASTTYQLAVTN